MKLTTALLSAACSAGVALAAYAPLAQAAAVQVMLFGQPCQIQGPAGVPDAQLSAIHQISPEQTPLSENPKNLQSSLERLKTAANLPPALASYITQRSKAIEARIAFEEALQSARKSRNAEQFGGALQKYLHPRRQKSLVKQFEKALKAGNSPHAWEQIRTEFAESSEGDGEEDFHRAIRKLKIVYQCSYEESQPADAQNEPAADEVIPPSGTPGKAKP